MQSHNPASRDQIILTGVSEHNLKSVTVAIPHDAITVVTGVSGSGKSSLVFDALYKESRRRFFETFSSHLRQFLGKVGRPAAEHMDNLSPALAVDQKNFFSNPRSTVGSISELYDLLRLLFARLGESPCETDDSIPLNKGRTINRSLFSFNTPEGACPSCNGLGVRDAIDPDLLVGDPSHTLRQGALRLTTPNGYIIYSQVTMEVLDQVCRAHGFSVDIPWRDLTPEQKYIILNGSDIIRIPFGKHPLESRLKWSGITPKPREEGYYKGILPIMENILRTDRNPNILRYARVFPCDECGGSRLNPFAQSILFHGHPIHYYAAMTIRELHDCFLSMSQENVGAREKATLEPIRSAILERCEILRELGLQYLTPNRSSATLSGGETQRLKLAVQACGQLRGVCFILDEPSIGLHQRDNRRLIQVLRRLRDNGNTIVAVEHEADIIFSADHVIDIGPGAGAEGGRILFQGSPPSLLRLPSAPDDPTSNSRTAQFLSGRATIPLPASRRAGNGHFLSIRNANLHNLKNISVSIPLGAFTVITGVSGAGKSTLASDLIGNFLENHFNSPPSLPRDTAVITGHEHLDKLILIDQSPIGRTPRSNPATYTKLFDHVRDLFAHLPEAKAKGFNKSRFSFNLSGGRCEACEGAGLQEIGMHFLGTVSAVCEECNGRRFNDATLEITYQDKNIHDILEMPIAEACAFFKDHPKITRALNVLNELGLGYLSLGQSAITLSGGEAQRIKLAAELSRPCSHRTLYILDEPTSGLHLADIKILLNCLDRLANKGASIIVVEHHPDVILHADHVIDLGPESGDEGGYVVAQGSPQTIAAHPTSHTGAMLREYLETNKKRSIPPQPPSPANSPQTKPSPKIPSPIRLRGISTHNLKNINLDIPMNAMTVITGVSGCGKSSLAFDTLFAESRNRFIGGLSTYGRALPSDNGERRFHEITGLPPAIAIARNNSGISRNPRSTVGSMTEIYDYLRMLYSRSSQLHCPECRKPLQDNACPAGHYHAPHPVLSTFFSFNHHLGACPHCKGLGAITSCDPAKLIAQPELPLPGGAMNHSKTGRFLGDPHGRHMAILLTAGTAHGFDFTQSWSILTPDAQHFALYGGGDRVYPVVWKFRRGARSGEHALNAPWEGLVNYVNHEYQQKHGGSRSKALEGLMSDTPCPACLGERLHPAARLAQFHGITLPHMTRLPIRDLIRFLRNLSSSTPNRAQYAASFLIPQIIRRLVFLEDLGLGYLSLDRGATTLSGGERQRIRLAGQLGSGLTRVAYILDEPTAGLHSRDTRLLIQRLRQLRDQGNAVIVVEHDFEVISAADYIIELGPAGGAAGGRLIASGALNDLLLHPESKTGRYLRCGFPKLPPSPSPIQVPIIKISGANAHNLKNIDIHIPGQGVIVFSGVSGSGKSSLLNSVIAASASAGRPRGCREITGLESFSGVFVINQTRPGGANPASIAGILHAIHELLAQTPDARNAGYPASFFSLNRKGGRCEPCQGTGRVDVAMDFLPDVRIACEHCNGAQFSPEALAITINGQNLRAILDMTIQEAREFFSQFPAIHSPLAILEETGLGYLPLGQPADTLSGGENQRLKLASEILKSQGDHRLYLLDEPTTGLHAEDIERLLHLFRRLRNEGHTLLVIEHHPDIIAAADYVFDLGPEGGDSGGEIVACGPPAFIAANPHSHTGRILAEKRSFSA